jgi:hypothetical protein
LLSRFQSARRIDEYRSWKPKDKTLVVVAGRKPKQGWKHRPLSLCESTWTKHKRVAARRKKSGIKNESADALIARELVYFGIKPERLKSKRLKRSLHSAAVRSTSSSAKRSRSFSEKTSGPFMDEDEKQQIAEFLERTREFKAKHPENYRDYFNRFKEEAFHDLNLTPQEVEAIIKIFELEYFS